MGNFKVLGSGCCGFLRFFNIVSSHIQITYKGGGPKYQNSFENWSERNGLIWESKSLSLEERTRRASINDIGNDIGHYYLPYVEEILSLRDDIKFLCLKGSRQHSIRKLATSWGYRNPCFVKDRSLGVGNNRYAVAQFPDLSNCENHFVAAEKYWDLYYEAAEVLESKFNDRFLIIDSIRFFENSEYQRECLGFIDLSIPFASMPVNLEKNDNTVTLHGGLGNNLFQISEAIAFCDQYGLEKPFFGTWDLWDGGGKYPSSYGADRFLGNHLGTQEEISKTFYNLKWRENLEADYDTTFIINDMFKFVDVNPKRDAILKNFSFSREILDYAEKKYGHLYKKPTVSIHLRTCSLPADDHVNGFIPDQFFINSIMEFDNDHVFLVFSDNVEEASRKIDLFRSKTNSSFFLIDEDVFKTLALMSLCQNHILHVSTLSFWGAYLNKNLEKAKVLYHDSWIKAHGKKMIPFDDWRKIDA